MEKSNEGFVSPVILGTDLATTGHSALALSITPVGTLAVQALMYQLRNGGMLIKQAQMSATVLKMGDIEWSDTPQQLLERVLATAASGVEHGGVETDAKSVSISVANLVTGQL